MPGINAMSRAPQGMSPDAQLPSGQEASAPMPDAGAEEAGTDEEIEGVQEASPEEQALYDRFVTRAMQLVTDDRMASKVIEMLKAPEDPREGLAQTAASIVFRVVQMAKEKGQDVPPDVLMHAGKEVFENIADFATALKIHDFNQDKEALDGAFYRAMDHFRILMTKNGYASKDQAMAGLKALQEADQSGRLARGIDSLSSQQES